MGATVGEAKNRYDAINEIAPGMGFVTLTVFTAHGLVTQGSPLDPQPLKAMLFGKPGNPVAKELVEMREVERLIASIAPHALLLANSVQIDIDDGVSTDTKYAEAVKAIRAVFEPAPAAQSALVVS